jgi:hypothetical protein
MSGRYHEFTLADAISSVAERLNGVPWETFNRGPVEWISKDDHSLHGVAY